MSKKPKDNDPDELVMDQRAGHSGVITRAEQAKNDKAAQRKPAKKPEDDN